MKKFILIALSFAFLLSCSKDENTSTIPVDDPSIGTGTLLAQGSMNGNMKYKVSGDVKVIDNNGIKSVRFEIFSSNNGPDLKVYLSKDANATSFINLGKLKSTAGNQNYIVSGMTDLSEYKYVFVWCQQFAVLSGAAKINQSPNKGHSGEQMYV